MTLPELTFTVLHDARCSWIHGHTEGIEVTRASFKECEEPLRRELIQLDTWPEFQRRGYARALLAHLARLEPIAPLINSPDEENTAAGRATVRAAINHGVAVHVFGCFRGGGACVCGLSLSS